jgi:hypothetical protein
MEPTDAKNDELRKNRPESWFTSFNKKVQQNKSNNLRLT